MAKISELPLLGAPVGGETVVVVSDGKTTQAPVGSLLGASVGTVAATKVVITKNVGGTNIALTNPKGVALVDGSIIEFRAPSNLTGPFTITTDQLGTVNFLNRVASPYTGLAFPAYTTIRAQWNAGGSVWSEYAAAAPLYVAQETDTRSTAALLGSGLLAGGVVASPIGGNPNHISVDVPDAADGSLFNVLAVVTNTGPLTMTAGGITRSVANGGGVDLAAGDFEAGTVYPLRYSPGGGKFATDGAAFPARVNAPPTDADLADKRWGEVTISPSGARTVKSIDKYIVMTGSSNAHPDYVGAAQLPSRSSSTRSTRRTQGAASIGLPTCVHSPVLPRPQSRASSPARYPIRRVVGFRTISASSA